MYHLPWCSVLGEPCPSLAFFTPAAVPLLFDVSHRGARLVLSFSAPLLVRPVARVADGSLFISQ